MGKGMACHSCIYCSEEHYDTPALGQAPGWTWERQGWRPCLRVVSLGTSRARPRLAGGVSSLPMFKDV